MQDWWQQTEVHCHHTLLEQQVHCTVERLLQAFFCHLRQLQALDVVRDAIVVVHVACRFINLTFSMANCFNLNLSTNQKYSKIDKCQTLAFKASKHRNTLVCVVQLIAQLLARHHDVVHLFLVEAVEQVPLLISVLLVCKHFLVKLQANSLAVFHNLVLNLVQHDNLHSCNYCVLYTASLIIISVSATRNSINGSGSSTAKFGLKILRIWKTILRNTRRGYFKTYINPRGYLVIVSTLHLHPHLSPLTLFPPSYHLILPLIPSSTLKFSFHSKSHYHLQLHHLHTLIFYLIQNFIQLFSYYLLNSQLYYNNITLIIRIISIIKITKISPIFIIKVAYKIIIFIITFINIF